MRIIPITDFGKFSFKRAAFTLEERIPQRVGKRTAIFASNAKTSDQNKEKQEREISSVDSLRSFTTNGKRQTVDLSSEFFRIKNKQLKTDQNDSHR